MQAGSNAKLTVQRLSVETATRNTGRVRRSCRQRPFPRDCVGRRTESAGLSRQRRQAVATSSQQADVVMSFVREEVDGEGIRQRNLATTFQVDRVEKQLYFRPTVLSVKMTSVRYT